VNAAISASVFWSSVRNELRADAEELRKRFNGKCAFCESKIEHISYPHIEHYRPKSRPEFERLTFDWNNWLLSCGRCNQSKWVHFPQCGRHPCLLNPVDDDPARHLDFKRALIFGLTRRGRQTIRLVGLERAPLSGERASWLSRIDALLLLATLGQSGEVKTESRQLLIWAMQEDAPYTAMTRSYLRDLAPRLANPIQPHPRIVGTDQMERVRELVEQHAHEIAGIE
jgi:uncharacterized protein (TIGR02646 family)